MHNHLDWLPLAFSAHCHAPLVTTIHGFSGRRILPAYKAARSSYVSISDADRCARARLRRDGPPRDRPGRRRLLPAGGDGPGRLRSDPPGQGHRRGDRHRAAGRPALVICGAVQDERYFDRWWRPDIDGDRVRYLGSVGPAPRPRCSAAPPRCCTRSTSLSRSACRWWRRWPAGRRSSLTRGVDAGDHRRWRHRLPRRGHAERPPRRSIDAAVAGSGGMSARGAARFPAERMVDDYLAEHMANSSEDIRWRALHPVSRKPNSDPSAGLTE